MASPADRYNGTLTQELEVFQFSTDMLIASAALLAYSHLILFGREVELVWKAPLRPASALYLIIRYFGLLSQLIEACLNSYTPDCSAVARLSLWTSTLAITAAYIFQILRTHAVCGRKPALAVLLTLLCLPSIVIDMMIAATASCNESDSSNDAVLNAQIATDFAFESVVFIATIWQTWALARSLSALKQPRTNLAECIIQNGLLYYGIIIALETIQIITTNIPASPTTIVAYDLVGILNYPIRWALLSQFMLELRGRTSEQNDPSLLSTPTMANFHSTVDFVRQAVEEDFGEALYPISDAPPASASERLGNSFVEGEVIQLREIREHYGGS